MLLDLRNAVEAADYREPSIVAFVNRRKMLPGFGVHVRRDDEGTLALLRMYSQAQSP
jgi:hypothetical protein